MARLGERDDVATDGGWRGSLRRIAGWAVQSYVLIIIIGIVVGLQVAPMVSEYAADPVTGTVAVVPLQGGINGANAASVASRLRQARNDPSIDAVVLQVNSGGGGAASSETIYLEVKKTAAEMPVVASIDGIAASGAYYGAAPADEIFVKPASLVGSIGVIFTAPAQIDPLDEIITTGPNKLNGADRREWLYKTDSIKTAFLNAVVESRGDRLELSRQEVQYAKLYTGGQSVSNGLADEIGGLDAAIKRAAEEAGLSNYRVKVLGYEGTVSFVTQAAYSAATVDDKELVSPTRFVRAPGEAAAPHVVMLPESVVRSAIEQGVSTNASAT